LTTKTTEAVIYETFAPLIQNSSSVSTKEVRKYNQQMTCIKLDYRILEEQSLDCIATTPDIKEV
jgi:hypothetical protein